jgi:VCBS repeat-containing protein
VVFAPSVWEAGWSVSSGTVVAMIGSIGGPGAGGVNLSSVLLNGSVVGAATSDGSTLTVTFDRGQAVGSLGTAVPGRTYYPTVSGSFAAGGVFVGQGAVRINRAPVASAQSVGTPEDTPLAITLGATDADGDPLTYAIVSGPIHGSLSGTAPNVAYAPNLNYNGTDSFTFKANDGTLDSNVATVSITVSAVNDAPFAVNDSYSTAEDTPLVVPTPGVLGNDGDVDGNPLTAVLVAGPVHGTLTLNANGSFTYNPGLNFNGSDSFTYKANDGAVDSNIATVSITVTPVNDAPVASNRSVTTPQNTPIAVTLSASDVDGDVLTYVVVGGPAHGTLSGTAPGLTYTPAAGYSGPDTFTFKANDGKADSNVATVSITVTGGNSVPVVTVSPASQSVQYSDNVAPITITATDSDSATLTVAFAPPLPTGLILVTPPAKTLLPNGGSAYIWTVKGNAKVAAGTYPINISVSDGSAVAVVTANLIVTPEIAAVSIPVTNPMLVQGSPTAGSGSFTLEATVMESTPDLPAGMAAYGDINNANVRFSLEPLLPGSTVAPASCTRSVSGTGYNKALKVLCNFSAVPVNTYGVKVTVDGGYYTGGGESALVVYDPNAATVYGGGLFLWPATLEPTVFAFVANKQGANTLGALLMVRVRADGSSYRLAGTTLTSLTTGKGTAPSLGWATISGKANYKPPGASTPAGNHGFEVYAEDRNQPGTGTDRFWIELKDPSGNVIPAFSMARPPASKAVPLLGGNIKVPH